MNTTRPSKGPRNFVLLAGGGGDPAGEGYRVIVAQCAISWPAAGS